MTYHFPCGTQGPLCCHQQIYMLLRLLMIFSTEQLSIMAATNIKEPLNLAFSAPDSWRHTIRAVISHKSQNIYHQFSPSAWLASLSHINFTNCIYQTGCLFCFIIHALRWLKCEGSMFQKATYNYISVIAPWSKPWNSGSIDGPYIMYDSELWMTIVCSTPWK